MNELFYAFVMFIAVHYRCHVSKGILNDLSAIRAMNIVRQGIFYLSGNILRTCGEIVCAFIMFIAVHYRFHVGKAVFNIFSAIRVMNIVRLGLFLPVRQDFLIIGTVNIFIIEYKVVFMP